jgi:hypothetical protein
MLVALLPLIPGAALAATPGDVVVNEILQNPSAVSDSNGEWFELTNTTSNPIDINGWTASDNDSDAFEIDNGGPLIIPANGYLVLGNNPDAGTNGGVAVDYGFSGMALANGADELVITDGFGVEIDRVEWDGGPAFPDPNGASMSLNDPANDNNVGSNWCTASTAFGDGDFGTPGAANDCTVTPPPPPACDTATGDLTKISAIQGDGFDSPLDGQQVTIRAVVTLADDDLDGYFVQEEPGDEDGDPATSEGLFVFDRRALPSEGQTVELTGNVTSFFGLTQLSFPDTAICDTPLVDIEPTPMSLPLDDLGREALEGMLVTNAQDLQVTGLFTAYRFGELGLAYMGPLAQPTSVYAPDDPRAAELAEANAQNELKVNDRNEAFSQFNPYPWELFDDDLSAGDTMPAGRLIGALGYSFGEYKVEPIDTAFFPETDDTFGRPDAPRLAGGNDVATFNVLNYFNTFGLRGASNQQEFDLQTAKIVDAITRLDAAVIGLTELENDYEDFYDGDKTTTPSIVTLVDALNAVDGKNTWEYIRPNKNMLVDDGDGGLGTDAIAVGIIYQRKRARAVGIATTFDIDALLEGDADNNRWPLAQTFKIDGRDVTVVVNHFKSKGSSCSDTAGPGFGFGDDAFGALTGNCDLTRRYAADRLVEWVSGGATNRKTDNVLLVGDFNSYEEEAPIEILVSAGYVDLVERDGDDAWTYKFNGRYGRLDYIFASPSLADDIGDAEVWQINSPAPTGYLYSNDPIDNSAHASSDHDPVVVSLK